MKDVHSLHSIKWLLNPQMNLSQEIHSIPITDVKHAKQELFETFRKLDEWNSYL